MNIICQNKSSFPEGFPASVSLHPFFDCYERHCWMKKSKGKKRGEAVSTSAGQQDIRDAWGMKRAKDFKKAKGTQLGRGWHET